MDRDIAAQLREPFPPEVVGHRPAITCGKCRNSPDKVCDQKSHVKRSCKTCGQWITSAHTHLDFVGHADVTDRLLKVDPDWDWEPLAIGENGLPVFDHNGGLWIKLRLGGETRLGYGHADGKKGGDAIKEAIGDAIRNAAMRRGVALDMWRKENAAPADEAQQTPSSAPVEQVNRPDAQRAAIAALGKKRGWDITTTAAEFMQWSRGQDILTASEAVLAEYIDFLQKVKE